MSIGVPIANAIALASAHGWHPAPPAPDIATPAWQLPLVMRAHLESGFAHQRAATRWANFLVAAAFRAAEAAAAQRLLGAATRAAV